jgi:hypothetical protein
MKSLVPSNRNRRVKYMVFACDCDPDSEDSRQGFSFHGIDAGIPQLCRELERISQEKGEAIPFTWNVRADLQMERLFGSTARCCEAFLDLWTGLEQRGHEIAWHPHLWRETATGLWTQEWRDPDWITECLTRGKEGFQNALGKAPETVHMGWCYQDDVTMSVLARLGVKIDYSALPGMISEGWELHPGVHTNKLDWLQTPRKPYFPSALDYRRPVESPREDSLNILQIPQSTIRSRLFHVLYHWKNSRRLKPGKGYVRIGMATDRRLFSRVFNRWLKTTPSEYGIFYFHAGDLVQGGWHSLPNLTANLEYVLGTLDPSVRYLTVSDLGGIIRQSL